MKELKYKYSTLVFIGRFQPFHLGHQTVVDEALQKALEVIILVGSSFSSRSLRNPFTYEERKQMIKSVYPQDNVIVMPIKDYPYDDNKWIAAVQDTVENTRMKHLLGRSDVPRGASTRVGLIGYEKDKSSYYLKLFPTWGNVAVDDTTNISATPIRKKMFEAKDMFPSQQLDMNIHVADLISGWIKYKDVSEVRSQRVSRDITMTKEISRPELQRPTKLQELFNEYDMIKAYRESWEVAPYPPTFVTTDVVIVQTKALTRKESACITGGVS